MPIGANKHAYFCIGVVPAGEQGRTHADACLVEASLRERDKRIEITEEQL